GTVMASAPSLERVRSRNCLPLRSNSMETTVTGCLRKSVLRTGASRIWSSAALVTEAASAARATVGTDPASAAAAVDWRNRRREVGMRIILPQRRFDQTAPSTEISGRFHNGL